ncbi:MAG TPA: exopolysaccharide biosynthesis protein [Holophagaceae bacterium]|nr:exopolysaccharide biosynthesis protein [Holophagaceae bacterium]
MPQPFFETLRSLLEEEGTLTLGEFMDRAGEQTYGFMVLLMALPGLVPGVNVVGAPVGGGIIMRMGWQMAKGQPHPWVPDRLQALELHKGRIQDALARLEDLLAKVRWQRFERRPISRRWMGLLLAWTGFLLALPVPLPFGNIAPAGVLVLQGVALLEERPVLGWLGALGSLAVTVYFALSAKLIVTELRRGIHWLWLRLA